jgi:pimeloyl-ACP methyl ester carboxylesterase
MPPRLRTGRRTIKALLPVAGLLALGLGALVVYLAYSVTHPPSQPYMLTPESFTKISARGVKTTEETWKNADGTQARGWLLRGDEGAPAVVMLHGYGSDRSAFLNLGVKLNETSNFTVLWPDLRGHGPNPPVSTTTFGAAEAEDLTAAVGFLRTLQSARRRPLVGPQVGVYGVGLGAYAALAWSAGHGQAASLRALALDSVPAAPEDLLHAALSARLGVESGLLRAFARTGARLLLVGGYKNEPSCGHAARLKGPAVLLLTGADAGPLRDSTRALSQCFPDDAAVEIRDDLPVSGARLSSASGVTGESYDLLVVDFFSRTLRADAPTPQH